MSVAYFKNDYQGFCFHENKIKELDVLDKEISAENFYVEYVLKRKPCILKSNLIFDDTWKNIDLNFLKKNIENVNVDLEEKTLDTFGIGEKKIMSFHNFLNLLQNGNSNFYLNTQNINHKKGKPLDLCGTVTSHFLKFFPRKLKLMGNLNIYQYNMWLGNNQSEHCKTFLHHDYHDNLYFLLKGEKVFRIYSPKFAHALETNGQIYRVYKNGMITYSPKYRHDGAKYSAVYNRNLEKYNKDNGMLLKNLKNLKKKNVSSEDTNKREKKIKKIKKALITNSYLSEETNEKKLINLLKCREWKMNIKDKEIPEHFCLIRTTERETDDIIFDEQTPVQQKYIKVSLKEGDILYLPSGWFHEVKSHAKNDEYHLALNYWYYPPYVIKDSSGNFKNKFQNPYKDSFLSKTNKTLYLKYGLYKKTKKHGCKFLIRKYKKKNKKLQKAYKSQNKQEEKHINQEHKE